MKNRTWGDNPAIPAHFLPKEIFLANGWAQLSKTRGYFVAILEQNKKRIRRKE
jgi:hypothetical protein